MSLVIEINNEQSNALRFPSFIVSVYNSSLPFYRRHLILSCQGRLNIFPFDDPLCSFAIESSEYHLKPNGFRIRPIERKKERELFSLSLSWVPPDKVNIFIFQYLTSKRRSRMCGRTTRVRCVKARAWRRWTRISLRIRQPRVPSKWAGEVSQTISCMSQRFLSWDFFFFRTFERNVVSDDTCIPCKNVVRRTVRWPVQSVLRQWSFKFLFLSCAINFSLFLAARICAHFSFLSILFLY